MSVVDARPAVGPEQLREQVQLEDLFARIDSGVLEREEQGRRPDAEFSLLKDARLGALRLPRSQGGGGAGLVELFEAVIALAEADPNVAHSLRNHFQFVESLLRRPEPQREVWLDHVRAGRLFGLAATELGDEKAGRRQERYATVLTRTGAGLRLDGEKFYSTGNLYADLLVVLATGPDGEPVQVVVPVDRGGVEIPDDWDGIGQRFTGSGSTRFVATPVEEGDLLGGAPLGQAPGQATYQATFPQLFLTAVIAGIMRRIVRDTAQLVRARTRTFYHSSADTPARDPILQLTVGELSSAAYVAEAAVLTAAAALARAFAAHGTPAEQELSVQAALRAAKAKVVVDGLALKAAGDLFDAAGGQAVRRRSHLDRHWRNIRTLAAHNPRTYKARAVGAYELEGTPLPNAAYF